MTPTRFATVGAMLAAAAYLGPAAAEIVETRELEESLSVAAGEPLVVIVRNVIGPVRVTGHDRNSVEMHAAFAQAPAEPTAFKTVNGTLDVTFPERLAAELAFQTMNGDVLTDFDVESLRDPPVVQTSRARGALVMRSNRNSAFRVGGGGTRHTFNTLNGNIYVRKANP